MEHPGFFERAAPVGLDVLAQKVGAALPAGADPSLLIHDVKALADAGPGHVTFLDNRKYLSLLGGTRASACGPANATVSRPSATSIAAAGMCRYQPGRLGAILSSSSRLVNATVSRRRRRRSST